MIASCRKTCISLTAVFLVTASSAALAESRLVIKPLFNFSTRQDSNYYKDPVNEVAVITYLLQPGISLGLEDDKFGFQFDYSLDSETYSGANESSFTGHTLRFSGSVKPTSRLRVLLSEELKKTRDPSDLDQFNNSVSRQEYLSNTLKPSLEIGLGERTTASVFYQQKLTNYTSEKEEDSGENRGGLGLNYRLSEDSSVDLKYDHWTMNYDKTSTDYTSDRMTVGLSHNLEFLALNGSVGYHDRKFDGGRLADLGMATFGLGIKLQNPARPEQARSELSVQLDRDYNDQGKGDAYYVTNKLALKGTHQFSRLLSGNLGYVLQKSDYKTANRQDDTSTISGEIAYQLMDWLALSVNGGYESRDSSAAGFDYTSSFVQGKLAFAYTLGSHKE